MAIMLAYYSKNYRIPKMCNLYSFEWGGGGERSFNMAALSHEASPSE